MSDERRDVTIGFRNGRTETIRGVSQDVARELEDLGQSGVAWTSSKPTTTSK